MLALYALCFAAPISYAENYAGIIDSSLELSETMYDHLGLLDLSIKIVPSYLYSQLFIVCCVL